MKLLVACTLLLALAAGCKSTPRPDPVPPHDQDSALIAVRIRGRDSIAPHSPRQTALSGAFFVKVADGADAARTTPVIRSNYCSGNVAYLLNAEPGRYAVVAIEETIEALPRPTYLSAEAIRSTLVDVAAGQRVMVGFLDVERSDLLSKSDDSQRFYRNKVIPPDERSANVWGYFRGPREYRSRSVRLNRDDSTLESMRKILHQQVGDYGW